MMRRLADRTRMVVTNTWKGGFPGYKWHKEVKDRELRSRIDYIQYPRGMMDLVKATLIDVRSAKIWKKEGK